MQNIHRLLGGSSHLATGEWGPSPVMTGKAIQWQGIIEVIEGDSMQVELPQKARTEAEESLEASIASEANDLTTHTYVCIYLYTYIHIYLYTYIHMYLYTYIHMYLYIHIYIYL